MNSDSNDNITTIEPGGMLKDYLKRVLREMPLGVCREILAAQEVNLLTIYPALDIGDLLRIGQVMRNCVDLTDKAIQEVGAGVLLGDIPDYNEETMLTLALFVLKGAVCP